MKTKNIFYLLCLIGFISCNQQQEKKSKLGSNDNNATSWVIKKRSIPAPESASEILYNSILAAPQPDYTRVQKVPDNDAQWKAYQRRKDSIWAQNALKMANSLSMKIEQNRLAGVTIRTITPLDLDQDFSESVFMHLHGGAYVLNAGDAGITEAILIAHWIKIAVISIDYRMPPDHPFPAALDDAVAVFEKILINYPDHTLFLGGTSAGGGLVMATILKLKEKKVKLPDAIFTGTPWADLTKTGDSFFINEGIDRILVTYDGFLEESAKLYANGRDLKDSFISPVYGDLSGFPPTFLVTGTRDLFLSITARAHRKLRDSGVEADLVVIEGLSHGEYLFPAHSPESEAVFKDLSKFLKQALR